MPPQLAEKLPVKFAIRTSDFKRVLNAPQNIHLMANAGRLRIALHGYNTPTDVTTLLRALHDILRTL